MDGVRAQESKIEHDSTTDIRVSIISLMQEWTSHVPENLGRSLFASIADAYWVRRSEEVRELENNLASIFRTTGYKNESVRRASRANLRSYMRYLHESALLPTLASSQVPIPIHMTGIRRLKDVTDAGRGAVIAIPHMANPEFAGAYLASAFGRVTVVANQFLPLARYDSYAKACQRLGVEVLAKERMSAHVAGNSSVKIFADLAQRLRAGGIVCLVSDRVSGVGNAATVQMFERRALLPIGPATLAVHTGAALFPGALWYEGNSWSGLVCDEIVLPDNATRKTEIANFTIKLSEAFECIIGCHFTDWHIPRSFFLDEFE